MFRFHKQLIDNQRWKYSAPLVDASSLIDQGYGDDVVHKTETMMSKMKQTTTRMRQGEHFYRGLGFGIRDLDDEHVSYNDDMYDHWKEFGSALAQYRYYLHQCPSGAEFSVYLCNLELPSEVLPLLEKALKEIRFKELTLEIIMPAAISPHLWPNSWKTMIVSMIMKTTISINVGT